MLLLAVVLMGLSVTRQQVLGTWHLHTDSGVRSASATSPVYTPGAPVSGLAHHWLSRWRQQQVFGHGQLRVGMSVGPLGGALAAAPVNAAKYLSPDHHHDALERHHHSPGDKGVIALDGAAESADSASPSASLSLSFFATPNAGLAPVATATLNGRWPICGAVRFASLTEAPLLRPPAA